MKRPIYIFVALVASIISNAQCGTDHYNYELLKDKLEKDEHYTDYLERQLASAERDVVFHKNGTRIIPVVFHIIHEYGEENISKAQIEDQMRIINEDFQRLNADTSKTRAYFKSRAANMDIQFKLARIDPEGNPTEGITRTYDPVNTIENFVDNDQEAKKAVRVWDPTKYMNVWVVKNIESNVQGRILGYAQFPGNNAETDGIVMVHDHVGSIGSSSLSNAGRTLTHEIGHWLGLYHPFQGTWNSTGCFGQGDRVSDTPPVEEASYGCTAAQNPNTCNTDSPDEIDNVENYMDYANGNCMNMFTEGQKSRVESFLASPSLRGNIISSANTVATGVNTNPVSTPIADFWYGQEKTTICAGQTFTFDGLSYNGDITSRTWTFEGGTPSTSSDEDPVITYNTPGTYKVELEVGNSSGSTKMTRTAFVTVLPSTSDNEAPFGISFTADTDDWQLEFEGSTGWRRNLVRGYSDDKSLEMIIDENSPFSTRFGATMPSVDVTSIGQDAKLYFRHAYARRVATATEVLIVMASDDCGDSWRTIAAYNGANLSTADVSPDWRPSSAVDWDSKVVDLSRYAESTNLRIRFDVISNSGNSVFIDNINVGRYALSTPHYLSEKQFTIFPNPAQDMVEVKLDENINQGTVSIVDIAGRLLLQQSLETSNQKISTAELANGVYSVVVVSEGKKWSKKLIISK